MVIFHSYVELPEGNHTNNLLAIFWGTPHGWCQAVPLLPLFAVLSLAIGWQARPGACARVPWNWFWTAWISTIYNIYIHMIIYVYVWISYNHIVKKCKNIYIYILYIHVHFPSSPGKEDLPFWPQDASSLGVQSPVDLQIRRSNGQIQFFGSPKKNEKRRPLFYTFLYFIIHFSILFYTWSLTFLYFSIYSAMTIHILATICSEQNAALEDTPTRRQHKYTVLVSLWIISDMEVS